MNTNFNRVTKLRSSNNFDGWDYTCDGRFPTPRVKGKQKRLRSRLRRRMEKRMIEI